MGTFGISGSEKSIKDGQEYGRWSSICYPSDDCALRSIEHCGSSMHGSIFPPTAVWISTALRHLLSDWANPGLNLGQKGDRTMGDATVACHDFGYKYLPGYSGSYYGLLWHRTWMGNYGVLQRV